MNKQNDSRLQESELSISGPTSGSKDFENFIYLLSHDVRNSVRALLEVPQWIKEDLAAEGHAIRGSLAEHFDLMDTHMRRLDRMLIDLLIYSRVGNKQSVQSMNLAEAVEDVLAQLPPLNGFQLTCDFACEEIRMGERDILTLLSALISNAIKHHHRKDGIAHISSRTIGTECVISIQDDGPGIPPKYKERVFEAMTTLKPRDESEGSGMGLAIVRKIVEFYSGQLSWTTPTGTFQTRLEIRFPV